MKMINIQFKTISKTLLLGFAISFSSCSDFLEEKVFTQITNEYLISTPEGMSATVNAMYAKDRYIFRSNADTETELWTNMMRGTDISVARAGSGSNEFGRYADLLPTNGVVKNFWNHHYMLIGYANIIAYAFENVDQEDPIAVKAVAEARAFRAHSYFWLLRRFDRIHLTIRVTTPENVNDPIEYKPADPQDVYRLINDDLDFAIAHLDWKSEAGRFNQAVARHLRAEVALWQKDYQQAIDQTEEIFNSNVYSLVSLDQLFGSADLNHSESLLLSCWSKDLGGNNITGSGTKPSGHRLSLHFIPRYEKLNGVKRTQEDGGYAWARTFPNDYLLGLYDKVADKRFTTFYKHNWVYNDAEKLPSGKVLGDTVTTSSKSVYFEQLHPGCIKYMDSWTRTVDETESFKDIILYRLAQTYLIAAEANLMMNNQEKAREYFNKTYMRAGNAAFTGDITLEMIIEEHARELAFEGHRWFFLKRLGLLVERVQLHGGEKTEMVNDISGRKNIQPFHVRWPIPQVEIDNMGKENFPQNEGYN